MAGQTEGLCRLGMIVTWFCNIHAWIWVRTKQRCISSMTSSNKKRNSETMSLDVTCTFCLKFCELWAEAVPCGMSCLPFTHFIVSKVIPMSACTSKIVSWFDPILDVKFDKPSYLHPCVHSEDSIQVCGCTKGVCLDPSICAPFRVISVLSYHSSWG